MRARTAGPGDHADAVEVWRAANLARGRPPDAARVARVRTKLADPAALVVVAVDDGAGCVGMALAEPGRADDGAGTAVPALCHLSMVFVDPDRWGSGVGPVLLDRVAVEARRRGHTRLQLWTGVHNHRAQRLYRRAGFVPTGRREQLSTGELVDHLARDLDRT